MMIHYTYLIIYYCLSSYLWVTKWWIFSYSAFPVDFFNSLFLAKKANFNNPFKMMIFLLKKYMCLTLYTSRFLAKNLW